MVTERRKPSPARLALLAALILRQRPRLPRRHGDWATIDNRRRAVVVTNPDGTQRRFCSASEAARQMGTSVHAASERCRKRHTDSHGRTWRYLED